MKEKAVALSDDDGFPYITPWFNGRNAQRKERRSLWSGFTIGRRNWAG
jgi:hypothetical protein